LARKPSPAGIGKAELTGKQGINPGRGQRNRGQQRVGLAVLAPKLQRATGPGLDTPQRVRPGNLTLDQLIGELVKLCDLVFVHL
jgi:hypothetical protein